MLFRSGSRVPRASLDAGGDGLATYRRALRGAARARSADVGAVSAEAGPVPVPQRLSIVLPTTGEFDSRTFRIASGLAARGPAQFLAGPEEGHALFVYRHGFACARVAPLARGPHLHRKCAETVKACSNQENMCSK